LTRPRVLAPALLAAACALVLATRVFVSFDPIRIKLVKAAVSQAEGRVRVDTARARPEWLASLTPPFAAIAGLQNNAPGAAAFTLKVDGASVCQFSVAGRTSRRVDCQVADRWTGAADHDITVEGPAADWALTSLELATHHGSTTSPLHLVMLPAASRHYEGLGPGWVVSAWLALFGFLSLPLRRTWPRALAIGHRVAAGIAIALFAAVWLSPYVSPFVVVISAESFVKLLGVLLASRLWIAAARVAATRPAQWAWSRLSRPASASVLVALVVFGAYATLAARHLRDYQGNYSGFLQIARDQLERVPFLKDRADVRQSLIVGESGYDGEFMYLDTFDPFLRLYRNEPARYRDVADFAPLRYSRIGFSLITKAASLDRWERYPATMVWVILASLFVCAWALASIARHYGASPAWGALILLVPGFTLSLWAALPEPVAAALLLCGYLCVLRGRWGWAGAACAGALLVRETGVLVVLCLVAERLWAGKRRDAIGLALISLTPVALWRLYVGWVLFPEWSWQAFFAFPHDLGLPFAGVIRLWTTIGRGDYFPNVPTLSRAGVWFPVILLGAIALAIAVARRSFNAISAAAVLYGVIAVLMSYEAVWLHVSNGQRLTADFFVLLAVSSVRMREYPRPLRAGLSACWTAVAAYMLYGAFDADYFRSAFWPW
jgi:hypothetical protein